MDEYIRLDTTVIGIDNLIAKASNVEEANALFKAKDVIYSQQRYLTYSQPEPTPVKHGRWINLTPTGQRAKQRMTWHGCVAWMCSECHGAARFFSEDLPYELCPHCGAIMTFGGGEEEQCAHAEYMERAAKECASEDGDSHDQTDR